MINIGIEFDSKTVQLGVIRKSIEAGIVRSVRDHIKKMVGSVRCGVHGQGPAIVIRLCDPNQLDYKISGCCEPLIDIGTKRLK